MERLVVLLILGSRIIYGQSTCSTTIKQGPYVFQQPILNMSIPTRQSLMFTRISIVEDAELAIMYRSYWASYCYMGGSIDPNTGCYRGITQDLPSYLETEEWIQKGKCLIGKDCTDCWGSDAEACILPDKNKTTWVNNKELKKLENNNHFLFHTCNLSWRCGLHIAKFPTFLTRNNNSWKAYTAFANGTEFYLDTTSYWVLDDMILKTVKIHQTVYSSVEVQCFLDDNFETACYDSETGIFFELVDNYYCFQKTCYLLANTHKKYNFKQNHIDEITQLKSAGLSDVAMVLAQERMLNEQMRYNFGKLTEEVVELRKILVNVILSVSKIDDRLIGNVMGHPARSQFLGETEFLLSPCAEPLTQGTNCVKDLIFKNGRWLKLKDSSECLNLTSVKSLNPFIRQELWLPRIKQQQLVGIAENFEGWSYFANERDNLDKAMQWTINGQQVTSLSDIYNLPNGVLNNILSGFVVSHGLTYIIVGLIAYVLSKKIDNNKPVVVNIAESKMEPGISKHKIKSNANLRRNKSRSLNNSILNINKMDSSDPQKITSFNDEWIDIPDELPKQQVIYSPKLKRRNSKRRKLGRFNQETIQFK